MSTPIAELDPNWTARCPSGHKHYVKNGALPTLTREHRCKECGHQMRPHLRVPQGEELVEEATVKLEGATLAVSGRTTRAKPSIPRKSGVVSVNIRQEVEDLEISTLGASGVRHFAGDRRVLMEVRIQDAAGFLRDFQLELDEDELKVGSDMYAKLGQSGYRKFAEWVMRRRGIR